MNSSSAHERPSRKCLFQITNPWCNSPNPTLLLADRTVVRTVCSGMLPRLGKENTPDAEGCHACRSRTTADAAVTAEFVPSRAMNMYMPFCPAFHPRPTLQNCIKSQRRSAWCKRDLQVNRMCSRLVLRRLVFWNALRIMVRSWRHQISPIRSCCFPKRYMITFQ